jgi:hypothetical protein
MSDRRRITIRNNGPRWRITIRNDDPCREIRGYFDGTYGDLSMFSDAMKPYGLVIASPADDDFDPFTEEAT